MNSSSISSTDSSNSVTESKVSQHPEYIQLRINGVAEVEAKAEISTENSQDKKQPAKLKKKKKLRRMTRVNNVSDFNFGFSKGLKATTQAIIKSNKVLNRGGTKSFNRSQTDKNIIKRTNSHDQNIKNALGEESEGSEVAKAEKTHKSKIKNLQKILKLRRKSTVDNMMFMSN